MFFAFVILAAVVIVSAVAAVSLRNLIHCAFSLAVALTGLAGIYLQLNAEFAGFAQILVYVGAVAILIVFAILLTREKEEASDFGYNAGAISSFLIAGLVFACIATAVLKAPWVGAGEPRAEPPAAPVRAIGEKLMREHVLPLEVIGLLLTAAMIGGVIIALPGAGRKGAVSSSKDSHPPDAARSS